MINPICMTGKTVLVTGASSGIGKETAILLSQLGAKVVISGRDQDRLSEVLKLMEGRDHSMISFDMSAIDQIPEWLQEVSKMSGPMDGLAHCAGIETTKPLRTLSIEDVREVFDVNVYPAIMLAKGFRHRKVHRNPCAIVFISSVMGLVGRPALTAYSATKGSLEAMSKSIALELAREDIRVNCVAPAYIESEMIGRLKKSLTTEQFEGIVSDHPLGLGQPRDVAHAVAFLLAESGRWITGTTLVVDGGYTAH